MAENLVSVTEAASILNLGRSQVLKLCNQGRLNAQKVGKTWVIPREAVENYKPAPTGFALIWEKRRAEEAAMQDEIKAAVDEAKKGEDQ